MDLSMAELTKLDYHGTPGFWAAVFWAAVFRAAVFWHGFRTRGVKAPGLVRAV